MNIIFIAKKDINRGSYRIWINDLNHYLKKANPSIKTQIIDINNLINAQTAPNSIIIIDKALIDSIIIRQYCEKYKKYKKCKIYVINPPAIKKEIYKIADGFIVGSIEEKDSLMKYKSNIIIFPLIEKIFNNPRRLKEHQDKKTIIIGYHGNPNHLNHLNLGCSRAINRISEKFKDYNFRMIVITNNIKGWVIGKPTNNIPIDYKKYNLETIEDDLLKIDIGIMPNISSYKCKHKTNNYDNILGKYETDIEIRFKNKSNNGRALVFHQLKIPVIADYIPSNLHILGDPKNGYAVCSEEGWYHAFKELLDYKRREFISENAYNEVKAKYNPEIWARELLEKL